MTRDEFWDLIGEVEGSEDPAEGIAELLEERTPEDIISYQEHFDAVFAEAFTWGLWGAAYVIEGGCSDDGFIDFRYGLIARGRDVFETAVADPDSLADLDDSDAISNELFGYAAFEVYENMTEEEEMPRKTTDKEPQPAGKQWDFDDGAQNAKRLPKLWAMYGE